MRRMLIIDEIDTIRCFVLLRETDLFRVCIVLLRENQAAGLYPSVDQAKENYRSMMRAIEDSRARFSNEARQRNETIDRTQRRTEIIDSLRQRIENKYLLEILFCERLEELLSKPMDEALEMKWVFDDGSTRNLAWTLLLLRKNKFGEEFELRDMRSLR